MCDPLTLAAASAALTATQQVAQFQAANVQADEAIAAANINFANDFTALSQQQAEAERRDAEASFDRAIQFAQSQGRLATAAVDSGLSGRNIGQLLRADAFAAGRADSIAQVNSDLETNQRRRQLAGLERGRSEQVRAAELSRPTALSAVIGLGQAGLQGANTFFALGGGG